MAVTGQLSRRLGTSDAVVIGLTAMIGAGVFVVWGPAARAAGRWLWVSLLLAAIVALCNATASAQLARRYPTSGGTYVYGREVLGHWWGFLAGWSFVVGKTASCAAMAMAVAAYAIPGGGGQRLLAMAAVAALTLANVLGVTKTAALARVLLVVALGALLTVLVVTAPTAVPTLPEALADLPEVGVFGVLQGAGLLFFAFAGYARIATLGEEVRHPEMIGRAILVAFSFAVILYAVMLVALTGTLGAGLSASVSPATDAVQTVGAGWVAPLVRVGAVGAAAGALLALLAGVARMTVAMARAGDLPRPLSSVDPVRSVPRVAQVLIGAAVCVVVGLVDLRGAVGFSSCGVLLYYFVANVAALRQPASEREWPRVLQVLGAAGCIVLVASLPLAAVVGGLAMIALGVLGRLLTR